MAISLWVLAGAVMLAQIWITVRLWKSALYTPKQQIAQSVLIWMLPVAGAIVVYAGLRHEEDVPRLKPNPEGGQHESLWGNSHLDHRE
jgi:hypothetical protein